jgi:hypothetical protein
MGKTEEVKGGRVKIQEENWKRGDFCVVVTPTRHMPPPFSGIYTVDFFYAPKMMEIVQ